MIGFDQDVTILKQRTELAAPISVSPKWGHGDNALEIWMRRLLDRRSTLALLAACGSHYALSDAQAAVVARDQPSSPFVRRVVRGPINSYSTYPHANGFLPDGRCLVARPSTVRGRAGLDYLAIDFSSGDIEPIASVAAARTYFAVSENGLLAIPKTFGVALIDLESPSRTEKQILSEPGWTVAEDLDISPDGSKILVARSHYAKPQGFEASTIVTAGGKLDRILHPSWQIDHAHFSPYAPSWICYAQNVRPPQRSTHRMWVWNARSAPNGRNIFDQVNDDGKTYVVSHERAMFHKAALLTIAHGSSAATPRGLYEVGFDGQRRLISESNRDFHCNISRDGRWAVVSLQGSADEQVSGVSAAFRGIQTPARPPSGWLKETGAGAFDISDIQLVDIHTGKRAFLFRATNAVSGQPYEVQPAISPDGKWVVFKDARARCAMAVEIDQGALNRFLSA